MLRKRFVFGWVLGVVFVGLIHASPASAGGGPPAASYDGMTTYRCKMGPIQLHPGQNLNLLGFTKTCPDAEKVSGPGDTSIFNPGSTAEGYVTRFKPSMVEIKSGGRLVTPSVWDLHLHHVVWLAPGGGPTFASGEEKTIARMPQGYGLPVGGDDTWSVNYMIHSLNASQNRRVYLTWEIDWVPQTVPERTDIQPIAIRWMDVAGFPQIYPVFDAERGFDADGDGKFVFPDDVPTNPSMPGYEERDKISPSGTWTLQNDATLVGGAGHLHPGGLHVDLEVARDLGDADSIPGSDPSEVKPLFRSDAHYYEPAGPISWDVSMEATRPSWRISLKAGDVLSIDTTYNVNRGSWYESMGILPLAYTTADDPLARDPFDDAPEVEAMYDAGGVLTHGRLPENIDSKANKNLRLPDPRKLPPSKRKLTNAGIKIRSFAYSIGGYSATRGFPSGPMRPPLVRPGTRVKFTNLDSPLSTTPQTQQVWHSITSCKPPCNRGPGIGYPLAAGPIKFDSGQLGYGTGLSTEVTTGSNQYRTPPLKAGKTYTYFCRIHPFMRGSIRVKGNRR